MCPPGWGIDAGSRWKGPAPDPDLRGISGPRAPVRAHGAEEGGTQGQKRHLVWFDGASSVSRRGTVGAPNLAKSPPPRGVSQGYAVSLELMGLGYAAETRAAVPPAAPLGGRPCPRRAPIPSLEQLARRISMAPSSQDFPRLGGEGEQGRNIPGA